ncbi:MAG: universal stress protein [Pseudomonadota bacterium]
MEIHSILVGVDFSEGSRSALHYAAGLARGFGARLVLVHVVDSHDLRIIADACGENEARTLERLRREAAERMVEFVAADDAEGTQVESLVTTGVPYHQLALKARELVVDLIVLGAQGAGRDRMEELFFGSTAEKVVRLLPCPVLCVPTLP